MRRKRRYYRKKFQTKKNKVRKTYIFVIAILMIICIFYVLKKDKISEDTAQEQMQNNKIIDSSVIGKDEVATGIAIIGKEDITYEDDSKQTPIIESNNNNLVNYDINYLKNAFYIVDQRTEFTADNFNAKKFLSKDLSINTKGDKPKVLIFHTHSCEVFSDSEPGNMEQGIVAVGELLAQTLNDKYGIKVMHHTGRYDYVNGSEQRLGAYERMEPEIQKLLDENPNIEVAIDLHRDGVPETTRLVKTINGKPTAQVMFFNGLCRYISNGKRVATSSNPNLADNLAFSFQMQLKAKELYPEFTRKIYLNAFRYSLHMRPRSLLIELGAQTNTFEEAKNAVEPLAKLLSEVLLKQ
jgi:stage II sporulation protein P